MFLQRGWLRTHIAFIQSWRHNLTKRKYWKRTRQLTREGELSSVLAAKCITTNWNHILIVYKVIAKLNWTNCDKNDTVQKFWEYAHIENICLSILAFFEFSVKKLNRPFQSNAVLYSGEEISAKRTNSWKFPEQIIKWPSKI